MSTLNLTKLGLGIDSPLANNTAENFRPSTWPPEQDFPIVIDATGKIISRYGDSEWNLSPWSKCRLQLNFGDGHQRRSSAKVSAENAAILRQIAAWWIYGPRSIRSPKTLARHVTDLKKIFIICTLEKILVTDLHKFPAVLDRIIDSTSASVLHVISVKLHALYESREELDFTILTPSEIKKLSTAKPQSAHTQTAYIPPRIWTYQVSRLKEFLDDFVSHEQNIIKCYNFCIDAYSNASNSNAKPKNNNRGPFCRPGPNGSISDRNSFLGLFSEIAEKFKISALLKKWIGDLDGAGRGVAILSSYFTLVGYVGTAYILNFSMMRIEEAWRLRSDCLTVEEDDQFGSFYILSGVTTKTIADDDARWITSPSVKLAVRAMTCVSRLRIEAAANNPDIVVSTQDLENPWLALRRYEPWGASFKKCKSVAIRPTYPSYFFIVESYKNLFDLNELTIRKTDIDLVRQISPGLDEEKFKEGEIWPLAWHQLRRTGAVNMQASNLVSDQSIQYQLKHASRAMSLYYGKGYSKLRFNNSTQSEYIATMYEILSKELQLLTSDRFNSPYGEKRKSAILNVVDLLDTKAIEQAVKRGEISWRPTLLGGCTKRGHCSYGGIDNIVRCAGGDGLGPCVDSIIDKNRKQLIHEFGEVLDARLQDAVPESPLYEALQAQKKSVEKVLNVIAYE